MEPRIHHVFSEAEYWYLEHEATEKHEYWRGSILAMAGGTVRHNQLGAQIGAMLVARRRGGRCFAVSSDQRIRAPSGLNTYPDAAVFCGTADIAPGSGDSATNPTVLVEILSPSTREYDRTDKLALYKEIPSLRDVLLVETDTPHVEHIYRTEYGWEVRIHHGLDAEVRLVGVEVTLPLAELYERGFDTP